MRTSKKQKGTPPFAAHAYHLLSAPTVARYAQAHAAALDLPPAYRAAVLVIGTAIGVGFPPPTTEGLLDLRI